MFLTSAFVKGKPNMKNELPKDLGKAKALFEEFESSEEYPTKAKRFEHAIELLSLFSEENPNSQHTKFVANLRLSYTRRFLEQLGTCDNMESEDWFNYLFIMVKTLNEVVENVSKQPSLKEPLEHFLRLRTITDEQGKEKEITVSKLLDAIKTTTDEE